MALSPMTSLRESLLLFSSFLLFQSMRLKSQAVQMFVQQDSLQLFDVLVVLLLLQNFDAENKVEIFVIQKGVILFELVIFCEIWQLLGFFNGAFWSSGIKQVIFDHKRSFLTCW